MIVAEPLFVPAVTTPVTLFTLATEELFELHDPPEGEPDKVVVPLVQIVATPDIDGVCKVGVTNNAAFPEFVVPQLFVTATK